MSTEERDPRLLSAERLGKVRELYARQYPACQLLAHIDALAAENAELRARAERAETGSRAWKAAAKHLHAQRAFHRTMQKWAAESIHDYEAKLVALRAAASVMVAANPTAEGARELAALVLGGEER